MGDSPTATTHAPSTLSTVSADATTATSAGNTFPITEQSEGGVEPPTWDESTIQTEPRSSTLNDSGVLAPLNETDQISADGSAPSPIVLNTHLPQQQGVETQPPQSHQELMSSIPTRHEWDAETLVERETSLDESRCGCDDCLEWSAGAVFKVTISPCLLLYMCSMAACDCCLFVSTACCLE